MLVYDVTNDRMTEVTAAEAAAGMMRYARTLGPGSAACGEWERRAVGATAQRGGEVSTTTTAPDGVTTVTLEGGRRLSYAPAATETGEAADGFNWATYSADDEIEAQDWARDGLAMRALVEAFEAFDGYEG